MKKADWQPVYESLRPFIEDAARTHYKPGDLQNGFKFWAVSQILTGVGLSDDALKEPLKLDGRGDLGLDGYFEDSESEALILIQSRFHDRPVAIGNDELNSFSSCLPKVLSPEVVVASRNPLAQDAHRTVREAIERGWTLRFVFLTSGYLSPEGRTFAETHQEGVELIDSVQVRKELEVYDLEKLQEEYSRNLTPKRLNTDVTLNVPSKDRHVSTVAGFKVLVAAIGARELVHAFRQHGYGIFRLNPRYSLQQSTVNPRIKKTLQDPASRKWFFHLNNGVTALCDNFREEGDYRVHIRDFQIVNGCQTTVTLSKMAAIVESDPDIKVLLRVYEGLRGIPVDISEATNMQNRLTAQDRKSNDPAQQDLKRRFDALPAPVFYEVKRGDWLVEQVQGDPKRYRDPISNEYRRINMVDLAQATLAFLGEPGRAKDQPRSIFEDESRYKKVFPIGVRPEQLLLPWQIYKQAEIMCADWTFPGAAYARFCLTAIVGHELAPSDELPPPHEASRLGAQVDRIAAILRRGQMAIVSQWAGLGDAYPGHREFFRSADFFTIVLKAFQAMPS